MFLEILLYVAYGLVLVLGSLLVILVSFIAMPIIIRVDAARGPETDAPPQILACIAPWYGLMAVAIHQIIDGWEARLLLFGRLCLYRHALVSTSEGKQPVDRPSDGRASTEPPAPSTIDTTRPGAVANVPQSTTLAEPRPTSTSEPKKAATAADTTESGAAEPGMGERIRNIWHDVRPFIKPSRRLLRRLLRIIGLQQLEVEATFGLQDAAQTGMLYGRLQAVRPFLPSWASIQLSADFTRVVTHGQARVRLHLYLARLLASAGRFALSAGWLWARRWWRLRRAARTLSSTVTD